MSQRKIVSYNVNGIRSAVSKGWLDWVAAENPDVILLQEIKAEAKDLPTEGLAALGYHHVHVHTAEKKGYSGVAVISKEAPKAVEAGCGMAEYDREGRILRADFEGYSAMSLYLPSGSSGEERQAFKFKMMDDFLPWLIVQREKYPNLVIGGDYNICHRAIDIHNPKSNAKSSGFLPEERAWMEKLVVENGFTDSFRYFHPEVTGQYSWWSFRFNSRAKNLGWRIDYLLVTPALVPAMRAATIKQDAVHSDHCPIVLELDLTQLS
jgi:exodeoxyribonuclease-3